MRLLETNERDATKRPAPPAKTQKLPPPPKDLLDEVGQREWKLKAKLLADDGDLTERDLPTLLLYCDAYSDFCRAVKELRKSKSSIIETGKTNGGKFRDPWFDIKKKAAAEISQYSSMLGFSTHDRGKIKRMANPLPDGSKPSNPFDGI